MDHNNLEIKEAKLEKLLSEYGSLLVAFSGGVDSTLLLAVAARVLENKVVAVTWASPVHSQREIKAAVDIVGMLDVPHRILKTDNLEPPELIENTRDRCYFCKKYLADRLMEIARELKIGTIAHGANLDDLDDIRPGFKAAKEAGMVAPLMDAGFTKENIRALSKKMGLPTWNKPAMACLASRIPYDTPIVPETLAKIDAAENAVLTLGFSACRVRYHGRMARIEVPPTELDRMLEKSCRLEIVRRLREIGFSFVALDLEGYEQGRMNRS